MTEATDNNVESETQDAEAQVVDPVLSEDEVEALVSGVENGDVEVQSGTGPRYAKVAEFEVPRRSRISTRSLPKLEVLNSRLADRLQIRSSEFLAVEIGVESAETYSARFGDLVDGSQSSLAAIEFSAEPLRGRGALTIDSDVVGRLVDLFFGGGLNDVSAAVDEGLTPGTLRVIEVYAKLALDALQATWEPLFAFEAKSVTTESNLSLLSIADETDMVVRSRFDIEIDGQSGALEILLPEKMISELLPILRGNHREPDPEQDQHWSECIQSAMPGVVVNLSSTLGHAEMSLGELICLKPGDVITISNPTNATILANNVSLMSARFGVHAGRNAVAAETWLTENTNQI